MIHGVHHIALATADMDRLLHFYRDLIGLPQLSDGRIEPGNTAFETVVGETDARVRIAQLGAGNVRIEIFHYEAPVPAPGELRRSRDVGLKHIAFDVTDIDAEYDRLVAAGVASISAPQSIGHNMVRSVYLRDPDGNIVELQEIFAGSGIDRSHVVGMTAG